MCHFFKMKFGKNKQEEECEKEVWGNEKGKLEKKKKRREKSNL